MPMEDNELLKDSLVSHKTFFGGHCKYDEFTDKLL